MVDRRANFTREVISSIENAYGGKIKIFAESVPRSVRAAEMSANGVSIYQHDPKGRVAAAYDALTPKSVQVISETLHRLEFENSKLASLQIIKTDEYNGEPLSGARFRVTTQNGEFVADVTTDVSGKASIHALAPGWYVISETKAPLGYIVSETARTVEVKPIVPTVVTITNRAENSLQIVKLDEYTRAPLARRVILKVECLQIEVNGESRIRQHEKLF